MKLSLPQVAKHHRAVCAFLSSLPSSKTSGLDTGLHKRIAPALTPEQWAQVSDSVARNFTKWRRQGAQWKRLKTPRRAKTVKPLPPQAPEVAGMLRR